MKPETDIQQQSSPGALHLPDASNPSSPHYGIFALKPHGEHTGWGVNISRWEKLYTHTFHFSVYGDNHFTLRLAQNYRDALLLVLPSMTERQIAEVRRSNNTSGYPGVYYKASQNKWTGRYTRNGKNYQKHFSVDIHGYEGAKALAIAARQELLETLENDFRIRDTYAHEVTQRHYSNLLEAPEQPDFDLLHQRML